MRDKIVAISTMDDLPCKAQSDADVASWIENAALKVGDKVAVRIGHGGTYRYYATKLIAVDHGRQHRLVVEPSGAFGASFYRSGKNCFHPKGQTRLVEPTSAVLKAAREHTIFIVTGARP